MVLDSHFFDMSEQREELDDQPSSDGSTTSRMEEEETKRRKRKKRKKKKVVGTDNAAEQPTNRMKVSAEERDDQSRESADSEHTRNSEEDAEVSEEEEFQPVTPEGCEPSMDVTLSDVMDSSYVSDDRWLTAVLLNVKKNETARAVSLYSRGSASSFGNTDAKYDRIMLLGCLATGTCFIVLNTSATKSAALLKKMGQKYMCIGQIIAVLEPKFDGKTLGKNDSLPMIEVKKPFVPYTLSKIPQQPFLPPEEPGTRFFLLQKAKIMVSGAMMLKGNCGGFLCDSQNVSHREKGCGCCVYTKGHPAYVVQMDVKVFDTNGVVEVFSMLNYSSWCFTNMVINNITQASKLEDFSDENERKMRQCIKHVVEFVNHNGGWNLCGWMRRGIQIDAGERDKRVSEEVTAENISPHIVMLRPTSVTTEYVKEHMGYRVGVKKIN